MAIVPDRSGNNPTDVTYMPFNRISAGEPNGVLTPAYVNEIVLDTTNNTLWKAMSVANNSWVALTPF